MSDFKYAVTKTEGMEVTEQPTAALPQQTEGLAWHIAVGAGTVKAGDVVSVNLHVNEKIGEGRRAQSKHVGYTTQQVEVKGLGKVYFKDGRNVQNAYFA